MSPLRDEARLLLVVAASAWLVACGSGKKSEVPPPPASSTAADAVSAARLVRLDPGALDRLGVRVEAAGTGAKSRSLHVPGTLDYDLEHYAEVGAPLEGRVSTLGVRVGDSVRKGQTLATVVVPSVASAQADYLNAQASAEAARKNRDREDDLLARQLTTAREAEIARSDARKAEADLAAAEARLRALRVVVPKNDAVVAGAGTLPLVAPLDGVVVQRRANLGQFLQPSDTAFVIADLRSLWASLDVHESDVAWLQVGEDVDVTIDAFPGRVFAGKLALVDPSLGRATRSVRARVAVPNPDGTLRPGLFVRASIKLPASAERTLLVPAAAVQPLGERDVVFVERERGLYELRQVRLGSRGSDLVEIRDGLAEGEPIAVAGAFLLRGEATKQ